MNNLSEEKGEFFEALAQAERNNDVEAQAELMQKLLEINIRIKEGE